MLKILKNLKLREWLFIALCIIFIVAQVWLDLKMPDYMSKITQLVQTPGSSMSSIWEQGAYMLLCTLGSAASAVAVGFIAARTAASFSKRLRRRLFSHIGSFSMQEINKFSTASLITRSTNDVIQVQMIITLGMQLIIKAPIMAVWAVTKISNKGYEWSLATAAAIFVLIIMITFVLIFVMPKFKLMQILTDNLNRITRENLSGIRVIRAFNAEEYTENKFEQANEDLTSTYLFTSRSMATLMPVMSMVLSGLTLAIYWIGAYLIDAAGIMDRITIFSDMVVFSAYAMQVIMSFLLLAMIFVMMPRASVSAKRINEILDTIPAIQDGPGVDAEHTLKGHIEFKNVSFKYPDAADYVLEDISFTAEQGQTVAFIGSTGSGKSTLINLVPRFFDATEGEILINGINTKQYKLHELNNKIGYVPQKAVLFRGSISENIAYGDNGKQKAELEQVEHAMRIAQGADFVEQMPDTYNSDISQGGTNLSGGQKQRVAIARAVCRQPEIYVFDDSFSALDYKTDRALRSALKSETAGVTSLIVAQRVGTILDADKIIVLENGKIAGMGTHKELLASCDVYKEIAMSQLSEKELIL